MTETTTPTPEQMRLYARMLRLDASGEAGRMDSTHMYAVADALDAIAASALDAKGETPQQVYASQASRYHSELLRRDIECSECRARSLRELAAPPLAPPWKEDGGFTCRYCGRVRVTGNPFWKCTKNQNGYCAPPPSAPSSPQPSSERLDPLQIVGPAPGTMHPVNQPSSEASAPQTEESEVDKLVADYKHVADNDGEHRIKDLVWLVNELIYEREHPRKSHAALIASAPILSKYHGQRWL